MEAEELDRSLPLREAWIEISKVNALKLTVDVASLAGSVD